MKTPTGVIVDAIDRAEEEGLPLDALSVVSQLGGVDRLDFTRMVTGWVNLGIMEVNNGIIRRKA